MPSLKERKAAARHRARQTRQAVPAAVRAEAGRQAAAHFMAAIPAPTAGCVSVYWPLADELDSRPLLQALVEAGHGVALPVTVAAGQPLQFRRWRPGDSLIQSGFGVMEPPPTAPEAQPAVVVAPYLACNAQGFRLGYGGGYYDRTLRALRQSVPGLLAVGFGFSCQIVAALPFDDTDEPLDWLVDETGARRTGGLS